MGEVAKMRPGTRVLFSGGWGESSFTMTGTIDGPFVDAKGKELEDVYVVLLDSGSVHYGYSNQFIPLAEDENDPQTFA